jgi:microcompartment protein CcmL/EutN
LQSYVTEVQGHQASVDQASEAAQSVGQNRSVALVAQLHTRYTSLLTFVKDTTKRLELEVEQFAQYVSARDKCSSWLSTTMDEITASRQVTGDAALLQARLDKLQVRGIK